MPAKRYRGRLTAEERKELDTQVNTGTGSARLLRSHVSANESNAYNSLHSFYEVARITHSRGEYRRGRASANAIESMWALVKRTYIGTHRWWGRKHTQRYLDAVSFRQNVMPGRHVATLLHAGMEPVALLPYKVLVQ